MQRSDWFSIDIYKDIFEIDINKLIFSLYPGDIIFLNGDLWSGKSTFTRELLKKHFVNNNLIVRSPTYTYYQKYWNNVYHFDLYRVESQEDLYLIWAVDILQNPDNICIIEWPEILWDSILPTKKIAISTSTEGSRDFSITNFNYPQ